MAGTFSQIYIQIVFAVKGREVTIGSEWEERLYQYITGIIRNKNQKLIAIGGTASHIHIFVGMKPSCCLSDLVREIKKASNDFVKENRLSKFYFSWQEGFGAFSYSHSQIDNVVKYILNQKEHHRKTTFRDEYIDFLKRFEVEHDEKYLFEWYE
ncbi:MAG: IS200/IS605 family transposase [Bacteroidia bacterium]|nr:IS200/IS605 family transposase [Bacteroidia bacterium]